MQHELRNIMEEKLKLQIQIEESQMTSQQQEILKQENMILKDRYKEMEKLYKEEITERDLRINHLEKERLVTKVICHKKYFGNFLAKLPFHSQMPYVSGMVCVILPLRGVGAY